MLNGCANNLITLFKSCHIDLPGLLMHSFLWGCTAECWPAQLTLTALKVSALPLFPGSMVRAPQVRTGASQVPLLNFHLSYDRGLHLSFQGVVTQGDWRVNAPPRPCEKWEISEGSAGTQFPKFTFQFKTNNNTLCLAWMSAATEGRRYVLFLHQ